jgi:ribosomal-protein-serine acetyltransferase
LKRERERGIISAKALDLISKSTEFGYWLDPELQNQGIMTRSLIGIIDWLIMEFAVEIFWIKCAQGNLPSQRVAKKAGFELVDLEKRIKGKTREVFLTFRLDKKPSP